MPRTGPNKTRAWRKIKHQFNPQTGCIERYGRRFKNAMFQLDKGAGLHPIYLWLMKSGGIGTPKFDYQQTIVDNDINSEEMINEAN